MDQASTFDMNAFRQHDHGRCRRDARAAVERECAARGLRLTPARAFVLDALLESHQALTAYELLDRLREAGLGKQPPIVYRALDFLVANGFAHRVERLGAFVGCVHGTEEHRAAFLVCRSCRRVAEAALAEPVPELAAEAEAVGFALERVTVEAEGLCARCRNA
jgi:Fur family transcriptional regulator, zinc uptake regulator